MKRRLTAAAIMLLFLSLLAVCCAFNAHQLFSRQMAFDWRISVCFLALFNVSQVRVWWLLLECCAILAVAWMLFGREYIKYKSKMIYICPGIVTPAADGQGQYGTARWMTDAEKEKAFTAVQIDDRAPPLRELMLHGQDDLKGDTPAHEII